MLLAAEMCLHAACDIVSGAMGAGVSHADYAPGLCVVDGFCLAFPRMHAWSCSRASSGEGMRHEAKRGADPREQWGGEPTEPRLFPPFSFLRSMSSGE